jgi:hypothetical protein
MDGIQIIIYPAFPEYDLKETDKDYKDACADWKQDGRWAMQRLKNENGGGPSIFGCMALAEEFESFLNQPYTKEQVDSWKATLDEALADFNKRQKKLFEKAMARQNNKRGIK